jgi:hypothetical protein
MGRSCARCWAACFSSARWRRERGRWKMGWARLLLAGALFLPGAGAEENGVPQRLVVEGRTGTCVTPSTRGTSA